MFSDTLTLFSESQSFFRPGLLSPRLGSLQLQPEQFRVDAEIFSTVDIFLLVCPGRCKMFQIFVVVIA